MAGRRRKKGKREPSGRIKRGRDQGTPEGQAKRRYMFAGGDLSFPLDTLVANGDISRGEYDAALHYAFCRFCCYGRQSMAAVAYDGDKPAGGRKTWPQPFIDNRRADYDRVRHGIEPRALTVLDNVVLFDRAPRWHRPLMPRPSDIVNARLLESAFAKLAYLSGYAAAANG
jgi:hypothetical protein